MRKVWDWLRHAHRTASLYILSFICKTHTQQQSGKLLYLQKNRNMMAGNARDPGTLVEMLS